MSDEIREFIGLDKPPIEGMEISDLRSEVDGWRVCFEMLPQEALEWMCRLNELVRFTKRDYKGAVGVLLGFRLEAVEFTIGVIEPGFDSIKGVRTLEKKTLVIPASGVAYKEFLSDVQDYADAVDEQQLGDTEL